jgi:hypothetical protein
MRALHWNMHWPSEAELANFLRRLRSNDIEIGLGTAVWAGLIFVVVHFGSGTA